MRTAMILLLAAMAAAPAWAQVVPVVPIQPDQPQPEEPDPRDVGRVARSRAATSVSNGIVSGSRNRYGCALGVYEAYTDNVFGTSLVSRDDTFTYLRPLFFVNSGSRRARLHADYSYGYRWYRTFDRMSTDEHRLNVDYSVRMSKRLTLALYERLDNSINDSFSQFSTGFYTSEGSAVPGYVPPYEYLRGAQKIFRNDAAVSLGIQTNRRGTLTFTTGYQTYRYDVRDYLTTDGAYGSVTYSQRLASWLTFSGSYTAYFTNVDSRYRDTQVQSLHVGDFSFNLPKKWRLSFGGGVDYATGGGYEGSRTAGSATASLVRSGQSNTLLLEYHHGLTTIFGRPGLYAMDSGTLSFLQRVTRRLSVQADGYYRHADGYYGAGRLEYFGVHTGLEFGLRRDLVATVNYTYQDQKAPTAGLDPWNFNRSMVWVGIVYYWPVRQN